MKKIYFVLLALIFSLNSNAQQNELNKLKTNLYYDILNTLLNSNDLVEFNNKLNKINFEREPAVFSDNNKQYSIMTNLPDDEKIIISYENSTKKPFRVVFIHHSTLYNNIESYLNNKTTYSDDHKLWYSYSKKFMLSYELGNSELAILNVYDSNYKW